MQNKYTNWEPKVIDEINEIAAQLFNFTQPIEKISSTNTVCTSTSEFKTSNQESEKPISIIDLINELEERLKETSLSMNLGLDTIINKHLKPHLALQSQISPHSYTSLSAPFITLTPNPQENGAEIYAPSLANLGDFPHSPFASKQDDIRSHSTPIKFMYI
jgi:hypothetical protein